MGNLAHVLNTDIELLKISPFDWFLDSGWVTIPRTDDETEKMNQERTLINNNLCTVYHVLFEPKYGQLAAQSCFNQSRTILLDEHPDAITVRVCFSGAWVLDFNAGYYWTEDGGSRTLEYSVQQSEGSLKQFPINSVQQSEDMLKFPTFKDMLCRLCKLTGNERLVERIERN